MFEKNFVIFYSAGSFMAETDQQEIDSWDVSKAVEMSKNITQRYGSHPYGFRFITKGRNDNDLDSKTIKSSGTYYIGGVIKTLEEIIAKNDPDNSILISNMKCNKWDAVVTVCNPYKWTQPLEKDDVVLQINKNGEFSGVSIKYDVR